MKNRKIPRFQSNDKRNKEELLERLKSYPHLRLRNRGALFILDTEKCPNQNIGGYGSISELHTALDNYSFNK
jgi:hypothetical protein